MDLVAGLCFVAALAVTGGTQAAPANAPAAGPADAIVPAQLTETPFPVEAQLAAALARAARGDFEGAAVAVAALVKADAPPGAAHDRIAREQERLLALARARRDFLDRCRQEARKLRLKQDDKFVTATVVEVTDEKIVVADAKGKRSEVPLAALDPDELLKRMADVKVESGSPATRAYAALLAGRKNWAKGLEGAGDAEAAPLRGDATGFPALLATGAAVLAIESLARTPLPAPGAPVEAALAAIRSLLADHGREAVVTERRTLLRRLAGRLFAIRFDANGIAGAGLKGGVEVLADGAVRLAYEFKTADGLADFVASEALHPSWPAFEIKLPKGQWKRTVDEEALVVVGQGCLRHRVEFEAPIRIDYEVEYGAPINSMSLFSTLRAALCDDGLGTMVTNLDLSSVDAYQRGQRILDSSDPGAATKEIATRITYVVGLSDDGRMAKLAVAERPDQQIAAPPFQRGGVALYWKSDARVKLWKITIEGRVAPDGLAALREAAVGRELAALLGE